MFPEMSDEAPVLRYQLPSPGCWRERLLAFNMLAWSHTGVDSGWGGAYGINCGPGSKIGYA